MTLQEVLSQADTVGILTQNISFAGQTQSSTNFIYNTFPAVMISRE